MPEQPTSPRVLCVDDNEDNCFMLYALLKRGGYEPMTCFAVGDALVLAAREEFDLFILDARYPVGTGAELCRHIREMRPGAKVIFYSGAALDEDQERGLEAGAYAYVKKPEVEGLLESVRRALDAG